MVLHLNLWVTVGVLVLCGQGPSCAVSGFSWWFQTSFRPLFSWDGEKAAKHAKVKGCVTAALFKLRACKSNNINN